LSDMKKGFQILVDLGVHSQSLIEDSHASHRASLLY
jgi:hypothetical protein